MPAFQQALNLTGCVNNIIDDPPEVGRPLIPLLTWIVVIVNAILTLMVETIKSLDTHLIELEETSSSESEAANETAAAAQAPAANQAEINRAMFLGLPPPQPQPPLPSTEHAAPAVTWGTRPPQNSRIAREARSTRNTPAPTPLSPAPVYAYQPPFAPTTPVPMAYTALAADATELRCQAAQSVQDKRLRQRRTATATTTCPS
ncbi:hypothetical protein DXG01_006660 [Tephrocybe rancida]|nr:hypothetical protein DXG01_006660 [Tephrocybe rancida]